LEAQERCDETIQRLVAGLSIILPFVKLVEKVAKLSNLQKTDIALLNLIEDASRFIVEYKLDGGAGA
jgi:hypothetical protein